MIERFNSQRWLLIGAGLLVWALVPQFGERHVVELLVFTGIYTIAGLGLGLLLGQGGVVSLAQATFCGLGAYSSAYATVMLQWPSVSGFALGVVISGTLAALVGWPILRLTGYFLALATLALSVIFTSLFFELDWLTGGELGIGGIPKLQIGEFSLNTPARMYVLVWLVAFGCMLLSYNIKQSRAGLMLNAVRDAEEAASSLGIKPLALRVRLFVVSAVFGSLAGSLFAHHVNFVSVHSFGIERSIVFLLIPVLGGSRSIIGVIAGALFVTFLPDLLSGIGDFHQVLFGLVMIAIVVLAPAGIVGLAQTLSMRRSSGV